MKSIDKILGPLPVQVPSEIRLLSGNPQTFGKKFLNLSQYIDRPCYRALADFARELLINTSPGSIVVDFAAGNCLWKPIFADCRYLAFDLGVGNVPIHHQWDWVGDVYNTPLANNSTDSVICLATLGHLAYPQKALLEMARILKPGGYLLAMSEFGKAKHMAPHDYSRLSAYALQAYLNEAGFETLRLEGSNSFYTTMLDLFESCWWKTGFADLKPPFRWLAGLIMRLMLRFGVINFLYRLDCGGTRQKDLMPVYFLTLARKK